MAELVVALKAYGRPLTRGRGLKPLAPVEETAGAASPAHTRARIETGSSGHDDSQESVARSHAGAD
jgi:hypothetical protein